MKELENEMPFVFYPSFRKQLRAIKNEKIKLLIYEALADYGVCGIEPDFSDIDPLGTVEALFVPMRQEIDKAKARYVASVENGKKGGNPNFQKGKPNPYYNPHITQDNPHITQDNPHITQDNLDKDIDNDKYKENLVSLRKQEKKAAGAATRSRAFVCPTEEEVRAYFQEKSLNGDPMEFYDHFTANGWMVGGKSKMKDWKAAARNWSRRATDFNRPKATELKDTTKFVNDLWK